MNRRQFSCCLMKVSDCFVAKSQLHLRIIPLLLAVLIVVPPVFAADKHWNTLGQGRWSEADKWLLPGVPGGADNAFIGTLAGVENETVFMDQPVTVNNLVITNGMGLQTSIHCCGEGVVGEKLTVHGVTSIGIDARLVVYNSSPGIDFESETLNILDNFALLQNAQIRLGTELNIGANGRIRGSGLVQLEGNGTTLINDGEIAQGPGTTTYTQLNNGVYDLDGITGNGVISVSSSGGVFPNASLILNGGGLTDSFSGEIQIGPHAILDMSVGPWTADAGSIIDVFGFSEAPRSLTGDQLTLAGLLDITSHAAFHVDADAVLATTATVNIGDEGYVRFAGFSTTTVQSGDFTLGLDSNLEFNGTTTLGGGTFHTHSNLSVDGLVRFNGATTWNGNVTVNGIAAQWGNANVSGPSVVTADVLDMDGGGGTSWNINHNLAIHADSVDSSISNSFDGVMNVSGGFFGKLAVHLTGAFEEWTMAGEMNLAGVGAAVFPIDRLDGSRMRVTGEVNVEHRVRINADSTFENSSVVRIDHATALLQLSGRTIVRENATFYGDGLLENGTTGDMILADGVSLGGVGLVNRGELELGNSPGTVAVDRFTNHATGTWLVEIGGQLPDEFDRLLMGGEAMLAGSIEVDLIDAGSGLFLPEIGETFTVLTAFGGVSGTFATNPISSVAGQNFHWSVIYTPQDVVLELIDITSSVPEPSSWALWSLAVALVGLFRPRRRLQ